MKKKNKKVFNLLCFVVIMCVLSINIFAVNTSQEPISEPEPQSQVEQSSQETPDNTANEEPKEEEKEEITTPSVSKPLDVEDNKNQDSEDDPVIEDDANPPVSQEEDTTKDEKEESSVVQSGLAKFQGIERVISLMGIEPLSITYGVTVAGVPVTSENADNITGGTIVSGTISYTPANGSERAKLILNNAQMFSGIVVSEPLTIEFIGTSTISASTGVGLAATDAIYFNGTGTIKFNGLTGISAGYVDGKQVSVNMISGTVEATGTTGHGIHGNVNTNGGSLTASSTSGSGVNGNVVARGGLTDINSVSGIALNGSAQAFEGATIDAYSKDNTAINTGATVEGGLIIARSDNATAVNGAVNVRNPQDDNGNYKYIGELKAYGDPSIGGTSDAGQNAMLDTGSGDGAGEFTTDIFIPEPAVDFHGNPYVRIYFVAPPEPESTVNLTPLEKTYDKTPFENSDIVGEVKVGDTVITGTWVFKDGQDLTDVTVNESGVVVSQPRDVIFTPNPGQAITRPIETTVSVTINKRPLHIGIVLDKDSLYIGESLPTPSIEYGEYIETDNIRPATDNTYSGIPVNSNASGDFTATWSNQGAIKTAIDANPRSINYDITYTTTAPFTIIAPQINITPLEKDYDGAPFTDGEITGTVTTPDNQTIPGTWTFVPGQDLTNATINDGGNVEEEDRNAIFTPDPSTGITTTFPGKVPITINKRPVDIRLDVNKDFIYVGQPLPTASLVYGEVVQGETIVPMAPTLVPNGMPADSNTAGEYTVTWGNFDAMKLAIEAMPDADNYDITYYKEDAFKILAITLDGGTLEKEYDKTPFDKDDISGTVEDENGNTIPGTWDFKDPNEDLTNVTPGKDVDVVFTPTDPTIPPIEGTVNVTINKRPATISLRLSANSITVGDPLPSAFLNYANVLPGDSLEPSSPSLATSGMPANSNRAGSYPVTWSNLNPDMKTAIEAMEAAKNYNITYNPNATFSIVAATVAPPVTTTTAAPTPPTTTPTTGGGGGTTPTVAPTTAAPTTVAPTTVTPTTVAPTTPTSTPSTGTGTTQAPGGGGEEDPNIEITPEGGIDIETGLPDEEFTGVIVDGNPLEDDEFTIEDGVVTILPGVLQELGDGEHEITIVYGDEAVDATVITDGGVPLSAAFNSWSLFDLLMTILAAILMVVYFLIKKKKNQDEELDQYGNTIEDEKTYKKKTYVKVFSAIVFIVAAVVFVITQDLTLPMTFFDEYSILFAILAVIQIVAGLFLINKGKEDKEDKEAQATT